MTDSHPPQPPTPSLQPPTPVLPILALFSAYDDALAWGIARAEASWGRVALRSRIFSFDQTAYYEATMGAGLKKQLVVFDRLFDPGELAARKRQTIEWERAYAKEAAHRVERPVNLDPGYLSEAKLVLASTKDRDHRIYIGEGIYAECTLYFHRGAWTCRPWTYPDFRTDAYREFLLEARQYYRTIKARA